MSPAWPAPSADPALLRERYETDLRPIIIGDLARHDQTLALWLEAYFGNRPTARRSCESIGRANVPRVSLDGRFRYARNYARDRPQGPKPAPASQAPKEKPLGKSATYRGVRFARLLDRPVC